VDYFAIPAFDQDKGDVGSWCKTKGFMSSAGGFSM
jgi:hypothetical protein